MRGAVPSLLVYAFMACRGTFLLFLVVWTLQKKKSFSQMFILNFFVMWGRLRTLRCMP
jgi:hypothetical protein